jgi:hypothetical protein
MLLSASSTLRIIVSQSRTVSLLPATFVAIANPCILKFILILELLKLFQKAHLVDIWFIQVCVQDMLVISKLYLLKVFKHLIIKPNLPIVFS